MMRAALAQPIQKTGQFAQRHGRVDERRIAEDSKQSILGHRTARPPRISVVVEPVVHNLMMDMCLVEQRDEDIDVEQGDQIPSPSSWSRLTSAVVMMRRGAPGGR